MADAAPPVGRLRRRRGGAGLRRAHRAGEAARGRHRGRASSTTTATRSCAGWSPTWSPRQDAAGNIKPDKARSTEKIDGVAAWCDALFAWAATPPDDEFHSVYETAASRASELRCDATAQARLERPRVIRGHPRDRRGHRLPRDRCRPRRYAPRLDRARDVPRPRGRSGRSAVRRVA